ncbi:hypothetical protein AB1K70_25145 [Bremerella sp. JC770]|uniref:hypothetical protein n=1 Tax=Bremerella sp. JC770 TaxID=3232137 RepID=UPI0034596966
MRFSLSGIFGVILALSICLAILRWNDYDLHRSIGVAGSLAGGGCIALLATLYFCDLVNITTRIMRSWEKRDPRDPPPR